MPIDDGDEFEAIFTAMGTVAPFFEYLRVLTDFLVGRGLPSRDAHQIVAGVFTGLLGQLREQEDPDFAELVKEHAPPGGGNEQLTALMREAGVFDGMARAVEEVHVRLTGAVR
jgi:pyrroline-5-carboxylate reductase